MILVIPPTAIATAENRLAGSFPDASYVFDQSDFAVAPPLSRWLRRRLHAQSELQSGTPTNGV